MFLDNCLTEERLGFPKAKATLARACDEALRREWSEMLRASFNCVFRHNARKMLALIDAEIAARGIPKTIFETGV